MKLDAAESTCARLALEVLESKLIDLVTADQFDALAPIFADRKACPAAIMKLFDLVASLCRDELGIPAKRKADGRPGIQ
jgi:hypothetical protein